MSSTNNFNKEIAGKILIWIGVLAWAPYLFLTFSGNYVSLLPFLGVHLIGVLGGIRLRGRRNTEHLVLDPRLRRLSAALIYMGVLAWAPYIYYHNILAEEIAIAPYLSIHLIGILGGGLVRLSAGISARRLREKGFSTSAE